MVPERPAARRRRSPLRRTCAEPHHCPRPVRLEVLGRVPFFAGLSPEEIGRIDARMVSLAWGEGEHLYSAGEAAEHLYVMAAGRAKLLQPTSSGQEVVTDLLVPGDLFGTLSTLGSPRQRDTAVALTTTCALRIGTADFRRVLAEHPTVALRVLDDVAAHLAEARTDVGRRSTEPVAQRVAAVLGRLADKLGQERAADGGTLLQIPLTRTDLAGLTGSAPESVSRVMARLRRAGVVDSGRRWTAVLDRERLADVAAGREPEVAERP